MAKESELFQRKSCILLTAFLCCLIWGSGYPLVKIGYTWFRIEAPDTLSKSLFAGIRFTVAGMLSIIYISLRKKRMVLPRRADIKGICLLSFFQTILQYMFIYIGLANTQGSKGSILNQLGVFLLVLFTPFIYTDEKLTVKKISGCVLGFCGIVIISLDGNMDMSFRMIGEGFVILSSVSAAAGYLISKRASQSGDAVTITGYQQLLGGMILILFGTAFGGHLQPVDAAAIGLLLFLSVSVAVAYVLWMLLLKYNEVSEIAMYKFGVPVFGVFFSGIFLRENIVNVKNLASLLLVSAGIFTVHFKWGYAAKAAVPQRIEEP